MNAWEQLVGMVERQTTEGIQAVDIADATWLAAHWEQSSASVDFVRPDGKKAEPPKSHPASSLTQEPKDLNPQKHTSGFADTDVSSKKSTDDPPAFDDYNLDLRLKVQGTGEPIICPAPPALSDADKISRALRAFNQRVPSRFRVIIDERATADAIAEENIWNPVLRPEPERRFGVALVAEKSIAMNFWQNVITELKQLLTRKGVFRDVRVWSLLRDGYEFKLSPGVTQEKHKRNWRSPSTIMEPAGRRLIFLISDCVSDSWRDGTIARQVRDWSRYGPVALLQVLPEHLWRRTGLGAAIPVRLTPKTAGASVLPFKAESLFTYDEEQLNDGALLPIATIEPLPVEQLAGLIAGRGSASGFYLYLKASNKRENGKAWNPEERLDRFWRTASPTARRLAMLLAAAPRIRLPVIRLVRASMLREANHTHEAEFLLSGLVEVTNASSEDNLHPDNIDYDFISGIREELLDSLSVVDAHQVLKNVSKYVEQHLGEARGFAAVLAKPNSFDTLQQDELPKPFAVVAASVLRRLGGRFKELLARIECVGKGPLK